MTTQQADGRVPDLSAFGARLALIRWQQGWNQKEAALACELPQNSWREWEVSGRAPRNLYEVAQKISKRTGIRDVFWIMTGETSGTDPDGGGAVRREGIEPPTR